MKAKDASFEALLIQLLLDYDRATPHGKKEIIHEITSFDNGINVFTDTTGRFIMNYPVIRETKEAILDEILNRVKRDEDEDD